ncbi:active regulator of SIRT1 isoform X3 [Rhinatrema bivittatum]|uniref:active regulator of SIRT1 isoform X3 n=1 Tax=Rhinatrema bivittatum TaxID=194408 RepID=UPI00112C017D|nr:active regulator of SIRT1 isoform X3 [Rhinatrema bivittatum]
MSASLLRKGLELLGAGEEAQDEYRKHQQKDQLQNNLQYMLGTTFVPDKQVKQQILSQNRGRKSIDRPTEKSKTKQKEKSVFSEADFLRFQREYFGGGVGGV